MGQSQTYCYPPQAILPLMKFLEVKLCYMNTNLVQENFSRSVAAACPAVSHRFLLSCPSFPAAGLGPPSQEKSICLPREGVDKLLRGGRGGGNHC